MKILVCGGRDFAYRDLLFETLDGLTDARMPDEVTIVHGGARGADTLADQYAKKHDFDVKEYGADWGRYGKGAGAIRNQVMLESEHTAKEPIDMVVAFAGGTGTADMVRRARVAGIKIIEVE